MGKPRPEGVPKNETRQSKIPTTRNTNEKWDTRSHSLPNIDSSGRGSDERLF